MFLAILLALACGGGDAYIVEGLVLEVSPSHVLVEQKAYFDGPGFNINSTVLGIHLNDFRRSCVAQGAT